MVFCGNGSVKWQTICNHNNAVFSDIAYNVEDLSTIAAQKFAESDFTEIAYAEPFYLKNVYTGSK
jgi:tRNA threonylcarbamoyladenosine biosynthesis protein TsaB